MVFSITVTALGDAAGSTTLTRNWPRHFTLGITQQLYETSVVHFVQTWKGVLPYANSHSFSGLAFTIAEYGWSCCGFLTLLLEAISFLSKTTRTGRSRRTPLFQSFCDLCEYRMLLVWRSEQEMETSKVTLARRSLFLVRCMGANDFCFE